MRTVRREPGAGGGGRRLERGGQQAGEERCTPGEWIRARAAVSEWVNDLLDRDADRAFEEFWAPLRDLGEDIVFDFESDESDLIFDDWLQFDRPIPGAGLVVDLFLAEGAQHLGPGERRVVEAMKAATLRLYEVEERSPRGPLRLRDVLEGDRLSVRDDCPGLRFQRADLIATRVAVGMPPGGPALDGVLVFGEGARAGVMARLAEEEARFLGRTPGGTAEAFYRTVPPLVHELWVRSVVGGRSPEPRRWRAA